MKNLNDISDEQVKSLWLAAFGDDEALVDSFLMRYYSRRRMLFVQSDGRMTAMLHLVPFETELGRATYIYAVATDAAYRGRGLAAQLLAEAMRIVSERGDRAAFLIPTPGVEWLRGFYARFGFTGSVPTQFRTADGFDFGTGHPASDRSMVWLKDASAPLPDALTATLAGD